MEELTRVRIKIPLSRIERYQEFKRWLKANVKRDYTFGTLDVKGEFALMFEAKFVDPDDALLFKVTCYE